MKEFNLATPCIKCGYSGNAADVEYNVGVFFEETQTAVNTAKMGYEPDDYLLRTCQRCGYKWAEKVIE